MLVNRIDFTGRSNFNSKKNTNSLSINKQNIAFEALAVKKAAQANSTFFNEYINSKKSILGFLKDKKMSPAAVFKFLCHATSDPRTSTVVAKEFSSNPRKGDGIKNFLVEKLGGAKKGTNLFWTWFHDEADGYRQAYANFYVNNVWNSAKNLNTLVKQSPNIAPWAFEGKAGEIGTEAILGDVPKEFKNISVYRKLISQLKESDFHKALMNVKDSEVKIKDSDTMKTATEANKKLQQFNKEFSVNVDGNIYNAKPIVQSFSAKLIYFITPEEDKTKRFVLKFDPYEMNELTDKARKLTENQALRADMPYLDAMVDFYLKENKSPNAPDVKLYDHATKSLLYGATEGDEPVISEKYTDNLYTFIKNSKISDLKKLGVELSDVHAGNFKVDKNGNYVLIDSGHTKFMNLFRPPVIGRNIVAGNLCGRELCK